jgi:glycerate-2-kinase
LCVPTRLEARGLHHKGARVTEIVSRLRRDAVAIWRAGVAAVDSERLVRDRVRFVDGRLDVAGHPFELSDASRIVAVGAGKAGAGMAAGLEQALAGTPAADRLSGWVNVPADCVRPLPHVHLHPARPAGVNEPTEAGVFGSHEILRLIRGLSAKDVGIVLLSGGGSALLPAPVSGISLADKQVVTRFLMSAGATINELNCVRKPLSEIKGGNLARAARGRPLVALIISDVIGDPLDVIASGPTVADRANAADARAVLSRFASDRSQIPETVWSVLEEKSRAPDEPPIPGNVVNVVIGNNATALAAANKTAIALGYETLSLGSEKQGLARDAGRELAELARTCRDSDSPPRPAMCILSGGEPVVRLVPTDRPRAGGRNQELVLAAVATLWDDGMDGLAIVSGGTDGEDGPTDAAGAVADANLMREAHKRGLDPDSFLAINNSYAFFEQTGGLLKTGPTHTNVMDVQILLVDRSAKKLRKANHD